MFSAILELIKGTPRWRKSTKCKSLIKQLKIRLAHQKCRQNAIIQQSRADIAQLLQKGQHHAALAKVEQLYKDQCKLSAYVQLENFCDCISENFHYISRSSKPPIDAVEAVSSLIFGASRCGELPELHCLRNLFKQHYGTMFERCNVELLPGNVVSSHLTHNLHKVFITQEMKLLLLLQVQEEHRTPASEMEKACKLSVQ